MENTVHVRDESNTVLTSQSCFSIQLLESSLNGKSQSGPLQLRVIIKAHSDMH